MEAKLPSGRGHEKTDASISGLVKFGVGLFLLIVVVLFSMRSMFEHFSTTQQLGPPASPFEETRTLPPAPRLQVHPVQELKQLRDGENDKLNSYGWVDQKAGIARIPVDRAMELLLTRGLPVRGENPPKPVKKSQ
jgi:hypothetical protein